ncbi:MAG: TIGR04211 family SH3 domain-containing protein [Pseudomonadota bacterium]
MTRIVRKVSRWSLATVLGVGCVAVSLLATSGPAAAQGNTQYVSDQFEVTMRRGPSTSNAIVRMLPSGTPLEVLSVDSQNGYSEVRLTTSNTTGFVLTRYLMNQRDARSQLAALQERLATLRSQSGEAGRELDDLRQANAEANRRIASLDQDNGRLRDELQALQQKAANVINIDRENTALRKDLTDTQIELQLVKEENSELSSKRIMHWFVIGAGVMLVGIVLGLILPGLRRRKRGGYGGGGDLL